MHSFRLCAVPRVDRPDLGVSKTTFTFKVIQTVHNCGGLLVWAFLMPQEIKMESEVVVSAQGRAWLEHSVLQPYISKFCADLQHKRYAAETRQHYLACVAHFAAWVAQHRLSLDKVDERSTARFVAEH